MKRIALCLFTASLLWSCDSKTEETPVQTVDTIDATVIQEIEESAQDLKEAAEQTTEEVDSLLNDI